MNFCLLYGICSKFVQNYKFQRILHESPFETNLFHKANYNACLNVIPYFLNSYPVSLKNELLVIFSLQSFVKKLSSSKIKSSVTSTTSMLPNFFKKKYR